ncbi:MAG TPA: preprotein translocase subunit SecG [Pirellulales bacterium]|nr:preprotein translocase subunit SecG [Pirellulales bacterium]
MGFIFGFLLIVTAAFLIMIVLLQRGRGGGLAGALGGMGGQSAFGAKAGDLFTRITIGVAAFWILLCILSVKVLSTPGKGFAGSTNAGSSGNSTTATGPAVPGTGSTTATGAKTGSNASGTSTPPEKPATAPQVPAGSGSDNSKAPPPAPPVNSDSKSPAPAVPPAAK